MRYLVIKKMKTLNKLLSFFKMNLFLLQLRVCWFVAFIALTFLSFHCFLSVGQYLETSRIPHPANLNLSSHLHVDHGQEQINHSHKHRHNEKEDEHEHHHFSTLNVSEIFFNRSTFFVCLMTEIRHIIPIFYSKRLSSSYSSDILRPPIYF
jgi:ABC-type nickel/cobalt efflux system permease component RcnA